MLKWGYLTQVYLGTNLTTKQNFAVKAFSKEFLMRQPKGRDSIVNEISILYDVNHQNLLRLHEVHESKHSLYLVCDYLEGSSLSDFLKKSVNILGDEEITAIMR